MGFELSALCGTADRGTEKFKTINAKMNATVKYKIPSSTINKDKTVDPSDPAARLMRKQCSLMNQCGIY